MTTGVPSPYRLDNVRSAIGHYLLGRGAGAVAGLVSAVLLVRHMEVRDYAAYTAVMGIAGIVAILASLGLERAVTRFVPEGRLFQSSRKLAALVWRLLTARFLAAALATLLLTVVWPWAMRLFDFITLVEIPPSLAIYLLASAAFELLSTVLQALVKQQLLTRITVVQWGGRLVWIVALIQQGGNLGLEEALWIMAIPELAGAVILLIAVASALRDTAASGAIDHATPWPDWNEVRHLAGHSYSFNLLASLPQGYFMRTLVAATLPVETVAAYGFLSNLVDRLRMYLPIQLMYNLAEPVLVARYLESKDAHGLIRNAQLMYKANLLLLEAALIFVLIGGADLVGILTKSKFIEQSWILTLLLLQTISGSHVLAMQLVLNVIKANQLLSKAGLLVLIAMLVFLGVVVISGYKTGILFGTLFYSLLLNALVLKMMAGVDVPYKLSFREGVRLIGIGAVLVCSTNILLNELVINGILEVAGIALLAAVLFIFLGLKFGIIDRVNLLAKAKSCIDTSKN